MPWASPLTQIMNNDNTKTILLVEDEGIIALSEAKMLRRHGYEVIMVPTGEQAIEAVKTLPDIDLILMDINLGTGMDGTQAAETILQKNDLPLVFLSSHTDPKVVKRTEGVASYSYIVKDSSEAVMIASIKMAFQLFEARMREKNKEEALRKSETRLREAQALAHIGHWELDAIKNELHWSEQVFQIFGKNPDQFRPSIESFDASVHSDDREFVIAEREAALKSNEDNDLEYRIVLPNGDIRHIFMRAKNFFDTRGNLIGVMGTIQDITERIQTEKTLRVALKEQNRGQREMQALLSASRAILEYDDFEVIARNIFDSCKDITGATAGYVSLLSFNGHEDKVIFQDFGGNDFTVDSSLPTPIRGLRCDAYENGEVVFENNLAPSERIQFTPDECVLPENVMLAPLVIEGKTQGLMGLANKPGGFNKIDIRIASAFGEMAAIALRNSRIMNQLYALQAKLREQVIRDPLTDLFNRRYLQDTLEREVSRAKRDKKTVSLIIMDVDYFKRINDSYGHLAGDEMLRAIGKILKEYIRFEDIPCRYGGEEFLIVMPGSSVQTALKRARILHKKITSLNIKYKKHILKVTVSIGIATFPEHGSSGEEVLIHADRALYQAKRDGRNRISVFQNSLQTPRP